MPDTSPPKPPSDPALLQSIFPEFGEGSISVSKSMAGSASPDVDPLSVFGWSIRRSHGCVEGQSVTRVVRGRFLAVQFSRLCSCIFGVAVRKLGKKFQEGRAQLLVIELLSRDVEYKLRGADDGSADRNCLCEATWVVRMGSCRNHSRAAQQDEEVEGPVPEAVKAFAVFVVPNVAQQCDAKRLGRRQIYFGLFQSSGCFRVLLFSSFSGLGSGLGLSSCAGRLGLVGSGLRGGGGGGGFFLSDAHCGVSLMRGLQSVQRLVASRPGRVRSVGPPPHARSRTGLPQAKLHPA